ncbi:methyltransferase [Streptomyces sp. NPDC049954]|uniref:methyltransferase n=1 Tax=Streptomyces sp. NPDC049954 TaxID=3155779 RepID=UPI003440DB33
MTDPGLRPAPSSPPSSQPASAGPPGEGTTHPERFADQVLLLRLIWGYMSSDLVDLATRLRVPELIGEDGAGAEEIARQVGGRERGETGGADGVEDGAHPLSVLRFLRALASLGLLTEDGPGHFRLTGAGARLRPDAPDSLYAFARQGTGVFRQAWSRLDHSVRTGAPAFDEVFGTGFFPYLRERPGLSAAFAASMREATRTLSTALAREYAFPQAGTVVDVGGADGTLLAAVLGARPGADRLTGVVFDSAEGAEDAPATLRAAGLAGRARVETGDFFTAVPEGGDLYVLKSVLHDWDDDKCAAILRGCRAAVPARGRLLVVEVLLPGRVTPGTDPLAYLSDLYMLVNMGGRERTEEDFRALLAATGFRTLGVTSPPALAPFSLIEAEPV